MLQGCLKLYLRSLKIVRVSLVLPERRATPLNFCLSSAAFIPKEEEKTRIRLAPPRSNSMLDSSRQQTHRILYIM